MKTMMRRLLPRRDEDGVALVAAMAVVMLVAMLMVVTVKIAMSESTASGRDRQRSSAVSTAESKVDTLMAQIQSSAPSALSSFCGTLTGTADVASDDFATASTVTYYKPDGVTEVPCASIPTTQVGYAKIRTSATSDALDNTSAAKRSVESLVSLTPAYGNDLDKAIFSNSNLTMSNKTVLTSASGTPDADIYTNGDFYCRNNQEFHGSIYAQGSVFLESQCTVSVDVWAKGKVQITNPSASIGGRVLSSSSTVSLDKAAVGQQARAAGVVTGQVCGTAGKCFSNVAVDAPPTVAFPELIWDAATQAQWAAHGYTNVVTFPQGMYTCGLYGGTTKVTGPDGHPVSLNGKADGVGMWLYENSWKLSGPTIVINTCPTSKIILQGVGILMNDNIVLLSRAGIQFTNNSQIKSVTGTATAADPNLLYFIQPAKYYGATTTCSGEGISLDNQVSVDSTVNTLLYSPCAIRKANQSTIVGQVYSGSTLSVDNQLDMAYVPLPVWGGIASQASIDSYSIQILYKRESA
ncbi:hypothetical protein ASD16_06575 [Cellulomonas sp. Root485]|nr:hypothetical protein ASD16_06575 [Cellulomonas sp. Root485]